MKDAVLTTWITQDHAITASQVNLFADIICSRARVSADPDLIARKWAASAFKQDRISSFQYGRESALECGISIEDFRARFMGAQNGAPRLHRAHHHMLSQRAEESRRRLLEGRHDPSAAT